jgi:hypothetical protein
MIELRRLMGLAGEARETDLIHPADRRHLLVLAAVIVASVALRLLTWSPIADGGHERYVRVAVVGAVSAAIVWWLVRLQTAPGSRLPLLCAAAVLLSGDAIHYLRLAHPISHGGPIVSFTASFADEASARRNLEFETSGAGRVVFERGGVRLESPPNATAYLRPRLPAPADPRSKWWLPVGLLERERVETLTWRASVTRTGDWYVVAEIRRLLIQAVPYGIHITYPDPQNVLRGHEIQHPLGRDGQVHTWQLVRDSRELTLSIDGTRVWSAAQRDPLDQIRLGETRADPQHGGSMRVEALSYHTTLERP